ncbi:MAG: protoporphyrinogen oxidase [Planctomycetes bacterium]|nr:protoporphyrinogen oxidase [Planctomycetota bacterium]
MRSVPTPEILRDRGYSIAVIGGGITGLAAAMQARQSGAEVHLFESSSRPGGWIRTTHEDDWILEWGPHSVLPTSPTLIRLAEQVGLGDSWRSARKNASKRYIWRDNSLRALPSNPLLIPFSRALSPLGWARLVAEPLIGRGGDEEESVRSFFRRRFGVEACRYLADAMVAGICGGIPEQLELNSFSPRLKEWEQRYGSVLMGFLRSPRPTGVPFQGTGTLQQGMESLPSALALELGDRFHPDTPVTAVERSKNGWKLFLDGAYPTDTIQVDGVIMALPAFVAGRLLTPCFPRVAEALNQIPYASMTLVQIGYDPESCSKRPDGFGFLVPRDQGLPILGTIWSSSIFPWRAPDTKSLATIFLGGTRDPGVVDESDRLLVDRAISALQSVHGQGLIPVMTAVGKATAAIPQQCLGHGKRVTTIRSELLSHPELVVAGGYMDGISLESCARSGEDAALQVVSHLASRQE